MEHLHHQPRIDRGSLTKLDEVTDGAHDDKADANGLRDLDELAFIGFMSERRN